MLLELNTAPWFFYYLLEALDHLIFVKDGLCHFGQAFISWTPYLVFNHILLSLLIKVKNQNEDRMREGGKSSKSTFLQPRLPPLEPPWNTTENTSWLTPWNTTDKPLNIP